MQLDSRGGSVHVAPMLCRHIGGRLHFVLSRFEPRLAGHRLYPDPRKLEIKSWVQLHHLELMKSCGRSVARSIARSKATGTSRVTAHRVTG